MNRGPYPIADHGLDTSADAHYANDWWDDRADRAFDERAAAAEWDWLTRNDPPPTPPTQTQLVHRPTTACGSFPQNPTNLTPNPQTNPPNTAKKHNRIRRKTLQR